MHCAEALKKTVASTVAASLLLVTPGTSAMAQQFSGRAAAPAPVAPIPAAAGAAALSRPSLTLPGALGAAPVLPSPTLSVAPVPAAAAPGAALAAPFPYKAAQAAPAVGRVAAPVAALKDTPGALGILSHQVRGADAAEAPEAAGWLAPAGEVLASPQASRAWAANAFDAMRGASVGSAASPVAGSEVKGRVNLLSRPGAAANKARDGVPAPGRGAQILKIAKFAVPAALGVTAYAMWAGLIPMYFLAPLVESLPTLGLSWPAMIALNVGVGIAVHVGKKILKNRKEAKAKAEEKAKAAEAAKSLSPEALTGEAAVEAVAKRLGTNQGVSVYDYSTGQMHEVPVEAELVEAVKAGKYKVTTDSSGAVILVPVLVSEEASAANAAKDEAKQEDAPAAPAPAPAPAEKAAEPAANSGGATLAEVETSPTSARVAPGKTPRSFSSLPVDAQTFDSARLAEGKAKAQERARAIASDARLVRVTMNLDDPRAHPAYVFYSKKQGKVLTVWQKRIGVKKGRETTDVLWNNRLAGIRSLAEAYAALKADAHWFKPVRVELRPHWKGPADYVFRDAKGREMKVSAAAAAPAPAPELPAPPAEEPEKPAPPAAEPAPTLPPPAERGPPPEAPPPPGEAPPAPGEPTAKLPKPAGPHIHEDLLGFRRVRGVTQGDAIRTLSIRARAPEVIDRIAAQFGIPRADVVAMGLRFGLRENSEPEAWLAVYDRLQAANRAEFENLDQKKYHGWGSFRVLANRTYPAGWKGALIRALEVHKHVVGLLVRLPLHLFDSFIIGYFRRAIAYEYFRGREDFFSVREGLDIEKAREKGTFTSDMLSRPRLAVRALEQVMQAQYLGGLTGRQRFEGKPWVRGLQRWVVRPWLAPLWKFVWRRATLAIFSAAAMGLVSGLVPLPLLGFHLTALPVLGTGLSWLTTGLPAAVAGIPFVGEGAAAVLSHAAETFLGEMTVGGVLNAFSLSTFLTFPNAVKMRLMEDRGEGRLSTPRLRERAFWHGVVGTFFSARFWWDNLKSFFGLVTVGAEIEAIMGYAGGLDGAVTPAFRAVTGHDFKLFSTVAAAIERPEGESPIPFGGAITWGNVLIYKLQNLVGLNITDEVYRFTRGLAYGDLTDAVSQQVINARTAAAAPADAAVVGGAEVPAGGGAPGGVSIVAAAVGAVSRAGAGSEMKGRTPGDIQAELGRTREAIAALESRIAGREQRLSDLGKDSNPVSEEDSRAYEETLRLLAQKSDQAYVQSKLAEIHDLKNPADGAAALKALEELADYYQTLLPAEGVSTGYAESVGVRLALVKTVQQAYADFQAGAGAITAAPARPASPVDREAAARIEPLVAEIERLRGDAKAELANRDALERLLSSVSKARNMALSERRSGREMLEFHKNMARLATVMDLAFSLNTIEASQRAILELQKLLDAKLEKIRRTAEQAERDRAEAERQRARQEEWRREIDENVADSRASQNDMADLERQTRDAVENIAGFRTDLRGLLARIDAADAGTSPNAKAEYDRRKALLPQIAEWNRTGKPGDADYTNLKQLREHLVEIDDYIRKVGDGLTQIDSAPLEFAGVLVVAVPGVPAVNVSNPSAAQTLQLLAERRAHWEKELAHYRETRDKFRNRMDPSFGGTETDDFGDVHPVSLPKRLASAQADVSRRSAAARELASRIDAAVADIRSAVPGADLPALGGLDRDAYRAAIEAYPDKLKGVVIPAAETTVNQNARMALLKVGRLLPPAAHEVIEWCKADATVTGVQEALASPVPQAAALYDAVVAGLGRILADVDADVAYVNAGFPQGQNQALIDRKRALLRSLQPMLTQARGVIADHAIPFQESAIRSFDPSGDKYAKLFDGQIRLYDGTKEAVDKTLPWALASNGAKEGDAAGALTNIEARRQRFRDLLTGYDDAAGHHKGVDEHLATIAKRKDPNNTETEDVYGQILPLSLPRVISQFTAEKEQRVGEMNRQNADLNAVLDRLEGLTGGRFGLAARKLPTGLGADQASVDRVQALVDARALQNLGDLLTAIGTEYKEKAGSVGLGEASGGGTVPTGQQPSPTVDENTMVALLALEAAKRLVPSSTTDLQAAPAAYAVARFLYSDAVVATAKENLYERIPRAEVFLNQAKAGLNDAIADLANDVAYVQANGGGEPADAVIDRKLRVYSSLNAVTRAGVEFYGLKIGWDQESYDTLGRMDTYYGSTTDIYANSGTVTANEIDAINKMKDALKKTFDDLEVQRQKLTRWLGQLNSPDESALKRVAQDLRDVQEKTRAVLEQNVQFHEVEGRFKRSEEILGWTLGRIDRSQAALAKELKALRDPATLDPSLRRRIEALRFEGSSWAMNGDSADATAALVIPKRDFARFVDTVFSALLTRVSSSRDLSGLRRQLLENPSSLSDVLPNSTVADFGDADGFYMVYQSQFSVPNGLETSSWVTLGNVAKLWGNNISVTGYQFASPPNDLNAPWGDKGVEVQVESLQGKNWVNYLNVDFHRFIQDIPPDTKMASTARQSRIMVFEDFAVLLFGDKLYVAFTGFADVATDKMREKPQFYGGSLKTSLKFTEVMRLNAEQQRVVAKDPRFFLETINLDFTGLDPDLNHPVTIDSRAKDKDYTRTQIGPSFDVGRLMDSKDAFTVDMFWAKQSGTDDYDQQSLGVSVLKGFSIRDADGKPWMTITNRAGAELGERQNIYSDRVNIALPNWGVAVSAEGRLIGDAKTYYLSAGKKLGDNSDISLGYGTRYPGMPERLTIAMNTSFTLGQLWRAVAAGTAEELQGGAALKGFDARLDAFYAANEDDVRVKELKAAFTRDVASRLVRQDIGRLAKDIRDLRAAGAFMDNTRVRGMVGFTSNPIGDGLADRAVGGGFTAGTQTTLTLNKTQKALLDQKVHSIYREGLRLQARMMDLTKEWEAVLVEAAEAQWELKMAKAMAEGAPDEALRRDGAARVAAAELRLRQAAVRYNTMVGRPEGEALPFTELSSADVSAVLAEIKKIMAAQDPLSEVMKGLDPEVMKDALGDQPFNLVDWIPWVDQITFSFGAQFQDFMANQVLGIGGSVRLPIYDPASKERDKAYRFEAEASMAEMLGVWEGYAARAEAERLESRGWEAGSELLGRRAEESARALADAVRGYRNGLVSQSRLREAYEQWRFYAGGMMTAASRASLAQGWAGLDQAFGRARPDQRAPSRVDTFQQAFDQAASSARGMDELEARRQAAEHMTLANASRIQKFYADLFIGWNISATGVGWLPSFGITGVGVTPILTFELKTDELRDLQVRQGEGQEAYYRHAKAKLEADLAVEFYRQAVAYTQGGRQAALLSSDLLPALEAAVAASASIADPAAREQARAKAQKELDAATRRHQLALQQREQARAAINHLLGRAPGAALDLGLTPEQALADLRVILAAKNPVTADQNVLDSRIAVARAVETMADKNLKVDELRLEPVSLVVRSLGRLARMLSEEGIGNPDLVAAARVQTLEAERARAAYDEDLPVRQAQARAELSAAESALRAARGRGDAAGRLEALDLEGRILLLQGALARLDAQAGAAPEGRMPATFAELGDRVAGAEQALAYSGRDAQVEAFEPERQLSRSVMGARYFRAKQDLGMNPIGQTFFESWVEFRLRAVGTPEAVLMALAKLRTDKATRIHANDSAAARARGQVLVSDFESTVRLKRWLDAQTALPASGGARRDLAAFARAVDTRLAVQAGRIKALLDLPAATPADALARLVPGDADGATGDVSALARRMLADVAALDVARLRETVFEGGIPESFGNEDSLINQIRADVIADRMSYKGFTPVAAFGVFRGQTVSGGYLEAPDPRSIEAGLQRVLSDSVRKELESQGRMRDLALNLHLLMTGVEGRAKLAERQAALVAAAQADYAAAAARVDRGLAGQEELFSAQDALVRSWLELSGTLTDLKRDFITLVTELEALGYDHKKLLGAPAALAPAAASGLPSAPNRAPAALLAEYASRRSLDPAFSERLAAALAALPGAGPEAAAAYTDAARWHREMYESAELVRRHPDYTPEERLALLTKADVEGRRQQVELVLSRVLVGLSAPSAPRAEVLAVISADLTAQAADAGGLDARERALEARLREAALNAVELPRAVRGAVDRLEELRGRLGERRQTLREEALKSRHAPTEFLLTDQALDRFLTAQAEYDAAVVRLYESAELKGDADLARFLDGLHPVRDALGRRTDLVRSGRGMLALTALIGLAADRVAALRWERGLPSELDAALAAERQLLELRTAWRAKDPKGLEPLVVLTRPGADGARSWRAENWLTESELNRAYGGRVVTDAAGRRWVTLQDGVRYEVVSGVDAAEGRLNAARGAHDANEARRRLYSTLSTSEFALLAMDGGAVEGLSYDQLAKRARAGQTFVFAAEADRRGLRPAVHPLKALWDGPGSVETIVYEGTARLGRDRFPTYESLREHLDSLRRAGDPASLAEAANFKRLEAGPEGLARMLESAKVLRERSERAGWIGLKLQSYGAAVDADGTPRRLYLTQDEFDAAVKDLNRAAVLLAEARGRLASARALRDAARAERDAAKPGADRESAAFQAVEREARARLKDKVAADTPRREGEGDVTHALRVKAALDEAVAKDRDVKRAQDRLGEAVEALNKLEQKARDAERAFDKALGEVRAAAELNAHAGQWAAVKAEVLPEIKKAMEESGLTKPEVEAEEGRLDGAGTRSLLVARDVLLHVDAANNLVRVSGTPVFGARTFEKAVGTPDGAVKTVGGELFAAVLDVDGRLVKLYMDRGVVAEAGRSWTLVGVDGREAGPVAGQSVDPHLRLLHYADPATALKNADGSPQPGTALPVMLNRRYMIELLSGSAQASADAKGWAYGPWNWGNILWEIPKGVLGTPLEIATGRDPNQHGYLGRAGMYKIEGGSTMHMGVFRKVLGVLDILDLMPDRVDWYFDPTQFPARVTLDSPLLPGENIHDKDLRAGKRDVHFGRQSLERTARYQAEDILDANRRVLAHFSGGVSETWLEDRRGREPGRTYTSSRRTGAVGADAVDDALLDDAIGADDRTLRPGEGPVSLTGRPGHVEVDRVERRVDVVPGAGNYGRVTDRLSGLPEVVAGRARAADGRAPGLAETRDKAQAETDARLAELGAARGEEDALRARAHEQGWRIGAQRALEREMARVRAELGQLRAELARQRQRLAELEDELRRLPTDPTNPTDPTDPNPLPTWPAWAWALALAAAAAAVALLIELLRRRRRPALA